MLYDSVNAVLIRVYSDLGNVGYYSVLHSDGCTTLLPVAEEEGLISIPNFMNPLRIRDKCTDKPIAHYYAFAKRSIKAVHNDPRIDLGFFTENYRGGRLPKKSIRIGDYVLFMSGLAEYPEKTWYLDRKEFYRLVKSLRKKGKVGIYIVGGIVVERKLVIRSRDWDSVSAKHPVLLYSPHNYWSERKDTLAVIGRGFYVKPPVRVATLTDTGFRPSAKLIRLVGRTAANKLVRQRFRKTGLLILDREKLEEIVLAYAVYH
ncbi:MAG: hypothetical protein DRO13_06310 [Thermoprotei archaeon]|nr:MAG: hypothetical protein DRO13_06310 [Thermoprotei archaeon]